MKLVIEYYLFATCTSIKSASLVTLKNFTGYDYFDSGQIFYTITIGMCYIHLGICEVKFLWYLTGPFIKKAWTRIY